MSVLTGELTLIICNQCGEKFSYECKLRGRPRQLCDACKKANITASQAAHEQTPKRKVSRAAYSQTPKDKAVKAAWRNSPGGRAHVAANQAIRNSLPEGKATILAWRRTPSGMACTARGKARRRERSTDPELFALRVELLHTLKESCAICGKLFERTHVIDHVLALCNGGIDEWDNYRPLCFECHGGKTAEDLKLFWGSTK